MDTTKTTDLTLAVQIPATELLAKEAESARATADFLVVSDETSLQCATDEMNGMNKRLKELDKLRKSITKPIDDAKKRVMEAFRPTTDAYTESIAIIKAGIAQYVNEQEHILAEERAKAEKAAEEERAALEAQAQTAETDEEKAAIAQAAALVTAAPVEEKVEKPKGMSTRKVFKVDVLDLSAFLKYAAEHPEVQECIEVKTAALERYVTSTGNSITLPGINVRQETIVSSRG